LERSHDSDYGPVSSRNFANILRRSKRLLTATSGANWFANSA
jgi:hypothetical protein